MLRLIGYWASSYDASWPDVRRFVDRSWDTTERSLVGDHLVRGRRVNQYRGLSQCRLCGRHNGSAELADDTYCWPEGLAHYVTVHDVRLPREFVQHVRSSPHVVEGTRAPEFDDMGQRDHYWPGPSPWGPDAEPFGEEWFVGTIRGFLSNGGRLALSIDHATVCPRCGTPVVFADERGASYCCLAGLTQHLMVSITRGGQDFAKYLARVAAPLQPPPTPIAHTDRTWWKATVGNG